MTSVGGPSSLWFGGDFNPEQWPADVRATDLALMEQLGVNTVTLPVFAWALLRPAKDRFEFGWLDEVIESVDSHGIGVVLSTPTAAQPPWMSAAYPEVLPVDAWGRRRRHGGRGNYCPTSGAYREESARVAAALADRYAGHRALRLWHVNNEYGPVCYCDGCRDGFRTWLAERYGALASLNDAWASNVWGNTMYDWTEVELPSALNAMEPARHGHVRFAPNPSAALDHARFCSAVLLDCFLNERAVIRGHTPDVPITTNFHGPVQVVDWHEWAPHLDVVSWDCYPRIDGHWADAAFGHDMARGARGARQGREFVVMEASPGPVNWHDRCAAKRPGRVRIEAIQAVAHGSRGMLYFQVRQARGGPELNHAALIPRHGRLDTRTGAELRRLRDDLDAIGPHTAAATVDADIAIVFDWPSWWAHHNTPGYDQRSRYLDTVRNVRRALATRGHAVDVVGAKSPLGRYRAVVAPLLFLVDDATVENLADYVRSGGTLVTTAGAAIVTESGLVHADGVDPRWRELVGLWVEETDVQPPDVVNQVRFAADGAVVAEAGVIYDVVRLETAVALAEFRDDFYAGSPAVTSNRFGDGAAVYVATLAAELVATAVDQAVGVPPDRTRPSGGAFDPSMVEIVTWSAGGEQLVFALNHGDAETTITLAPGDWVDVLDRTRHSDSVTIAASDAVVLRGPP